MCEKVLILHHFEPYWNLALQKNGTDFDKLLDAFYDFSRRRKFSKIVVTNFELNREQYLEWSMGDYFLNKVDEIIEYGYGWERDCFEDGKEGIDYCNGGNHSEVVMLEDWMRDLQGKEVFIGGCFDGECLEDLEIALNYLEIPYQRIEELIA